MRILVYPHELRMGGSQINAVQLAAELHRLGHEVIVYGQPGELTEEIARCGLRFIEAPAPGRRPSPTVIKHLYSVIRDERVDVVHGYEWPPILEAVLATRGTPAVPVGTVMSMAVAPFLPRPISLSVGTEQIAAAECLRGRGHVHVVEPPVDVDREDEVEESDVDEFRREWGLQADVPTVVMVNRLADELKLEGMLTTIAAVGHVARARRIGLLIVGEGPARPQVEALAAQVNAAAGRPVIVLTGALTDPRPAYRAADIAVGMGGSALRSMAHGTPLVVQGEGGFFQLLTGTSQHRFLWSGWYGHGSEHADPLAHLVQVLIELLDDRERRLELGALGRSLVMRRFALSRQAESVLQMYQQAAGRGRPILGIVEVVRSVLSWAGYQTRRRVARLLGRGIQDDFNALPLARFTLSGTSCSEAGVPCLLYYANAPWDETPGTDRLVVEALVRTRPVLWVDPPQPWLGRRRNPLPGVTHLGPGLLRLRPLSPPGARLVGVRWLFRRRVNRQVLATARAWGRPPTGLVCSSPDQSALPLPRGVPRLRYTTGINVRA